MTDRLPPPGPARDALIKQSIAEVIVAARDLAREYDGIDARHATSELAARLYLGMPLEVLAPMAAALAIREVRRSETQPPTLETP